MGDKFIPNGDYKFREMAIAFANAIAKEPALFQLTREESDELSAVVQRYHVALYAAFCPGTRCQKTTIRKNETRAQAEKEIRRVANRLRGDSRVDSLVKLKLGLQERTGKPKRQKCPQEPPKLRFVRARHIGASASPMHELVFRGVEGSSKAKPDGAVRLELFVDLVPSGEQIPKHPGANHGGRPWYLRSYTRSPIIVAPPMTRTAMRVVYWGRWADSTGNVGPFSSTAVGWIEEGPSYALIQSTNYPTLMADDEAKTGRDETVSVRVLEARYQQLNPQDMTPRQLESDAA